MKKNFEKKNNSKILEKKKVTENDDSRPSRVVVDALYPNVDSGRFPAKRSLGEKVHARAVILCDGHEMLRCHLCYRHESQSKAEASRISMRNDGNDGWHAEFTVTEYGKYHFTAEASIDRLGTWLRDFRKKVQAHLWENVDLETGVQLLREIQLAVQKSEIRSSRKFTGKLTGNVASKSSGSLTRNMSGAGGEEIIAGAIALLKAKVKPKKQTATALQVDSLTDSRADSLNDSLAISQTNFADFFAKENELIELAGQVQDPSFVQFPMELSIEVDSPLATNSAWYEFFPRSMLGAKAKSVHGHFANCDEQLAYVAAMGFDIVYLPPIHPIGKKFRKGRNNAVSAQAGDVGSPWAIGGEEGGFYDVHPELGSIDDFKKFLKKANALGLRVALDIAFQCSPDHPYVKEHPGWFKQRPDGSIQYAENPPKKYQDIYPFDFECEDRQGLWHELKNVVEFWVKNGVKVFRVDNPHTKPFHFWDWLIKEIRSVHPEVVFLAEAFSRPNIMAYLAKSGFNQSYTYFTWRNTKAELTEYMTELTATNLVEYFRPNFWPNTPDILNAELQSGGPATFSRRLVLAATLSSSYGIYGPAYELCEGTAKDKGSEEYLDSEKYEIKKWDLKSPISIAPLITRVNKIRRENPALASNRRLKFLQIPDDRLLAYIKTSEDGENIIITVVNLSSTEVAMGMLDLPLLELGLKPGVPFVVRDLLTDTKYSWKDWQNYVELDPKKAQAHIFRIERGLL